MQINQLASEPAPSTRQRAGTSRPKLTELQLLDGVRQSSTDSAGQQPPIPVGRAEHFIMQTDGTITALQPEPQPELEPAQQTETQDDECTAGVHVASFEEAEAMSWHLEHLEYDPSLLACAYAVALLVRCTTYIWS
jgi:hypothetical protein